MSAPVFTAKQISRVLGCTAARVRQLMAFAQNPCTITVRGQPAQAWGIADFPRKVRERLAALAEIHGCRDVAHLLLSNSATWTPGLPASQIDELQLDVAGARRDVLAPILQRGGYTAKVSALVSQAMSYCPALHPRTVRRWIELAKERDDMQGEWQRPELYLDEKIKSKAEAVPQKSFLDVDAVMHAPALWLACCHELRARTGNNESLNAEKRDILSHVRRHPLMQGKSAQALRKTLDRNWKKFCDSGAISDARQNNPGRSPEATLSPEEIAKAKRLFLETGSVTSALRLLATSPDCSEKVADVILRRRSSKHSIPRTIRRQIAVSDATREYFKSPTKMKRRSFVNPRSLTYIDRGGEEKPLTPGDLFERDDMSNNFLCWVPWPWGGDPCSDRFGVRVARGQNLLMIDAASLYFTSFNFLVRLRDSYRADDIWQWVRGTYRDIGMPRIGERWERGTWASRKLRGDSEAYIEAGHTDELLRLGGMSALGLRVIESQSPTTKIIENRFNFFQTICGTIPTLQIGRQRGEMERENKLWTAMRQGRRDPREHLLSYEQVSEHIEAKLHYLNSEPVEGNLYNGIPAQLWQEGIETKPLSRLDESKAFIFARDKHVITATKCHVMVRFTRQDKTRGAWWFHHRDLHRYEGQRMDVYLDHYTPESGATIVHAEGPERGRVLGHAEHIEGAPQFALGFQTGEDTAAADRLCAGLDRRKAFTDAVIAEYRSIVPGGKRGTRQVRFDDGSGRRSEIVTGAAPSRFEGTANIPSTGAGKNAGRKLVKKAHTLRQQNDWTDEIQARELAKVKQLENKARLRGDLFST